MCQVSASGVSLCRILDTIKYVNDLVALKGGVKEYHVVPDFIES